MKEHQEAAVTSIPSAEPDRAERLRRKSLAICSGKGGVGKTTTAANLALYYARKGLRVGLIDLDPLSDIATLLDLQEPGEALQAPASSGLDRFTLAILPGLDLLFPAPKLSRAESRSLLDRVYRQHPDELDRRYDLLIFDLPAGSDAEENLAFLPFMRQLILVTNPEPTAHVSAGAYVRRALEEVPQASFRVWHNRYSGNAGDGFDPADLAGNYNRNVPEELRLTAREKERLEDFCFVPEDPSLNLLKGEPDALLNLLYRLAEVFRLIHAERLRRIAAGMGFSRRSFDLVLYYVGRHRRIESVDTYLADLGLYLGSLLPAPSEPAPLPPAESRLLAAFLETAREDRRLAAAARLLDLLDERIGRAEGAHRLFSTSAGTPEDRALERECSRFLMEIAGDAELAGGLKSLGGLLLFYFSLFKLFQSPSIVRLVRGSIPRKKDRRGRTVRDRGEQIRRLMTPGGGHRREFLRLLRALYPILTRQLSGVVRVFRLRRLVLRDAAGAFHRTAYLSLLTHFLHDTLFSGLSVVVGFAYRPACAAFQRGAERILQSLDVEPPAPPG